MDIKKDERNSIMKPYTIIATIDNLNHMLPIYESKIFYRASTKEIMESFAKMFEKKPPYVNLDNHENNINCQKEQIVIKCNHADQVKFLENITSLEVITFPEGEREQDIFPFQERINIINYIKTEDVYTNSIIYTNNQKELGQYIKSLVL